MMSSESISEFINKFISFDYIPRMVATDYIEILIIAFLIYEVMLWIKNTKAWSLLRGTVVIMLFILMAYIFQMNTIIWIVRNALGVIITAMIVVFQPELRRALDILGRKNFLSPLFQLNSMQNTTERFSDKTMNEIIKACYEMGRARTGALIVMSQNDSLDEYERTGIYLDSLVSSQLLINIFEHNTPLHDGAIVIEGDRIVSATCYLPLSDNMALSKELGTRHRAGVGISEVTDSLTIIVSEETGHVSVAYEGGLSRSINDGELREFMVKLQNKKPVEDNNRFRLWKGRADGQK